MLIADLFDYPHLIPHAVALVQNEWPDPKRSAADVGQRLVGDRDRTKLPCALVALDEEALVGLVSLTRWAAGAEMGRPHWIDAVIVFPSHRGKNISQLLIAAAEEKAKAFGVKQLLALTEIPRLYLKRGWSVLDAPTPNAPLDYVMQKTL